MQWYFTYFTSIKKKSWEVVNKLKGQDSNQDMLDSKVNAIPITSSGFTWQGVSTYDIILRFSKVLASRSAN